MSAVRYLISATRKSAVTSYASGSSPAHPAKLIVHGTIPSLSFMLMILSHLVIKYTVREAIQSGQTAEAEHPTISI